MADSSLGVAVLRTRLDSSGLRTGLNQARNETTKATGDMTGAIRGIGAAFGAIAASAGVRSYISFLSSSANLAHQADAAHRLFEKSLQRTNQSVSEGAGLVDRLSQRFGVANSIIEDSATLMLRQGASLDDVERALTAAGASAAAAGFDISTSFNNVATAVATGRSELLETSGIVANLGPVAQAYAKSVGKTVEELTQQELVQARVNAIYRETASEIEDVDEILAGLPLAQAKVTQGWRDFREDVGGIAQEVIVPLTNGLGAVLGYVNDLPEPVKRAGLAMSGAAIGATALATGIVAIRAALQGLSAAGLLSFGPAGWIVLGVTAVAGLVAVLTGGQGSEASLEDAISRVNVAASDTDALEGFDDTITTLADNLSGPVKRAFEGARDDIQAIVTSAESAREALARISLGTNLAQELQGDLNLSGVVGGVIDTRGAEFNQAGRLRQALFRGDFNAATGIIGELISSFEAIGDSGAVDRLTNFLDEVNKAEQEIQGLLTGSPTPTNTGGGATSTDKVAKRAQALKNELANLQREVDLGLADAATLAERQFNAVDAAVRDLLRLGASDALINALLGDRAGFEAQVRERAARIAPIIRAELFDERLRAERDEIDTLSVQAGNEARVAQQQRETERLAAVARAPLIRAEEFDIAWFEERQEIEDQAIRAHNEARVAQQRRESEELAAAARAPLIRAEQFDSDLRAEREETEQLEADLAAARVRRENRRQADIRAAIAAVAGPGENAPLHAQFAGHLDRELNREVERFRSMDLTTTNSDRAAEAEARLARAREEGQRIGREAARAEELRWRDINAAVRFGGAAGVAYTEQLQLQTDAMRLASEEGITLTEALRRLTGGLTASQAAFGAAAGNLSLQLGRRADRGDGGLEEARRIIEEQQQAADRFSETVVSAGFRMGDAAIQAIQDGDIPALLREGFSGAGSILGAADLGSIPFLGGNIAVGGIIAGVLGLFGSLFGSAGGQSDAGQARAAGAAVRGAPAVELNLVINQSLNVQSLTDSASRNAVNGLLDQTVRRLEDAIVRNLIPRVTRLEGAA